ncbi:MAG: pilus assembly protein [Myxococcota bacterium]
MTSNRLARVLVVCAALALAREVRAQAGDLDILSRTVPPIVIIQFDTSGSMSNLILPDQYLTDRGNYPTTELWFNKSSSSSTTAVLDPNYPASFIAPTATYYCGSSSGCSATKLNTASVEDYRPTCQLFNSTSATTANSSVCTPVASPTSSTCKVGGNTISDDDADQNNPLGGTATIRCWNVPGGCTYVPTGLLCSTAARNRKKTSSTTVSQPYTIITFPNVSTGGATTDVPPNYMWWMMQQIYLGKSPVLYMGQDRNNAAKQAITTLVNNVNLNGLPDKVKFGLARYSTSGNGGYIVVPPTLGNKTVLLSTIAGLPATGGTPLSETLVDVGRYLAGADKLGSYPQYNRDTNGNTVAASSAPQSPVTSSCEKLFVIAITDGLPTGDCNDHYGTAFTSTFGKYNNGDESCAAGGRDYLDDVAAGLYATDLRKTVSGNQNVITYTVGFTVASSRLQLAATRGAGQYFQSNNADNLADSLTGALQDIIAKNTTLTSATVPASRTAFGDGYYTAYFVPTGTKSVWPGKLEAYTLSPTLVVMDDNNNPAIDPVTDLFIEPRHPHWELGATLMTDYASRTVYTTKGTTRVPFTAANFTDPNSSATSLTPAMLNLTAADTTLYPQPSTNIAITDPNAPAGNLARLGGSIIDWVRGTDSFDEDGDGSRTNARPFVLGDIFHSSPVVVGPPLPYLRFETGYGPSTTTTSFMGLYGHRPRILYVGANDGMLHGVNAGSFVDPNTNVTGDEYYTSGTGHELFGYVPGFLLSNIKSLPRDNMPKQYFVDGPPSAADAWIDYNANGTKEGSDWTTVLITPMRQGGEGLLALDVSDPNATGGNHGPYPRLMWEFTNAGLGQTWSRPIITRVKMKGTTGSGDKCGPNDGDGDCFEQWVAIFGAGYEDVANPNMGGFISDPNNASFAKGRGAYMIRIKDGTVLAHLQFAANDANSPNLSLMKYAVAAEPSVLDLNNDGFADVVYFGDLAGQMWKWDLSKIGSLNAAGVVPTSVWPAGVVFQAPVANIGSGTLHYHSIFQSAAAAMWKGVLTLSFGSGERADLGYTGAADPNNPTNLVGLYDDNNRFWVMEDLQPTGAGAFPSSLPIQEAPAAAGHQSLTDVTNLGSDNDPNDAGYFFRLKDGEKFMTDPIVFGGEVLTLSYMPDAANAGLNGNCALGGTSNAFEFSLASGTGALVGSTSGTPPPPSPADRSQPLGNGAPTNPKITISGNTVGMMVQDSGGGSHNFNPNVKFDQVDMLYWRQEF